MNEAPEPPRRSAGESDPAEIGDGGFTSDRREAAAMAIDERLGIGPPQNARRNELGDVGAALLGCRCQTGHGLATPRVRPRCVADDEHVWKVGNRKVALDLD